MTRTTRIRFVPFVMAALLAGVPYVAHAQTATPAAPAAAVGVTGTYKWEQVGRGGNATEITLKLKQEGDKITGIITGQGGQESEIQEGVAKGKDITFKVIRDANGQKMVTAYTVTVDGDTIKGKSEQITTREVNGKRAAE